MNEQQSIAVQLAWKSIRHYLGQGTRLELSDADKALLPQPAGAFVSLKKNGRLRGCIGTFLPACATVAEEIVQNAVSAATQDPRFAPVVAAELAEISISVDILSAPEGVEKLDQLDPQRYGVIVRRGGRSGLLLPMLDGVDTVEEQLAIARQKAGIAPGEPVDIYRFSVVRYT